MDKDVVTSPFMDPELSFEVYKNHEGHPSYAIALHASLEEHGVWHNGWAVTWEIRTWRNVTFATAIQVGDRFFFTPMGKGTMPGYVSFDKMRDVARRLYDDFMEEDRRVREAQRALEEERKAKQV